MKQLTLLMIFGISFLFGDFNNFIENMKKQERYYQDSNTSEEAKKKIIEKFDFSNKISTTEEQQQVLINLKNTSDVAATSSIPWINQNISSGGYQKEIQEALKAIEHSSNDTKKIDTIFYLFSMSQNNYVLYNFTLDASKLESVNKDIKYYGVVQGILSTENLDSLYKPFEFDKELAEKTIIKMHPIMFKDLQLDRAPAYLFSKCSVGEFRYKSCENKYLVRGDISLHAALEIVVKEDKSYTEYLNTLEQRAEK